MSNNIFVNIPKRGDIVLGDLSTKKPVFVTLDSFDYSLLDSSAYELLGIVIAIKGRKVKVLWKGGHLGACKYCERCTFKITGGYTLDGEAHEVTFGILPTSAQSDARETFTVSYTATTTDELITSLNTAFAADDTANKYDVYAFTGTDGNLYLEHNAGVWWQYGVTTDSSSTTGLYISGLSLSVAVPVENPVLIPNTLYAKNGHYSGRIGHAQNVSRAYAYGKSITSYWNKDAVDFTKLSGGSQPIPLSSYLNDDECATFRELFGSDEEGYKKFLKAQQAVRDTKFGTSSDDVDGLTVSKSLREFTYTTNNVTDKVKYPAFAKIKEVLDAAAPVCIPADNWYLPTLGDVADITYDIEYGTSSDRTADLLNAALLKTGGSSIPNNLYLWACLRGHALNTWCFGGSDGVLYHGNVCHGHYVAPVSLLTI